MLLVALQVGIIIWESCLFRLATTPSSLIYKDAVSVSDAIIAKPAVWLQVPPAMAESIIRRVWAVPCDYLSYVCDCVACSGVDPEVVILPCSEFNVEIASHS